MFLRPQVRPPIDQLRLILRLYHIGRLETEIVHRIVRWAETRSSCDSVLEIHISPERRWTFAVSFGRYIRVSVFAMRALRGISILFSVSFFPTWNEEKHSTRILFHLDCAEWAPESPWITSLDMLLGNLNSYKSTKSGNSLKNPVECNQRKCIRSTKQNWRHGRNVLDSENEARVKSVTQLLKCINFLRDASSWIRSVRPGVSITGRRGVCARDWTPVSLIPRCWCSENRNACAWTASVQRGPTGVEDCASRFVWPHFFSFPVLTINATTWPTIESSSDRNRGRERHL